MRVLRLVHISALQKRLERRPTKENILRALSWLADTYLQISHHEFIVPKCSYVDRTFIIVCSSFEFRRRMPTTIRVLNIPVLVLLFFSTRGAEDVGIHIGLFELAEAAPDDGSLKYNV